MSTNDRIVVTGIGLVTPIGIGIDENWENLMAGRSGIGTITRFDPSDLSTRFAGEVKNFDATDFMDRKEVRHYDRFLHFAVAASDLALKDAGLDKDSLPADRTGVLVGSGMGGMETFVANTLALENRGPRRVSPFFVPAIIGNMASGLLTIRYGVRGANFAIASACATGAHSIGEGLRMLQNDKADVMIVGGAEAAIIPLGVAGFIAARALSARNEEPERACRPFDVDRDGFVMGEGAGILILEKESTARARNARIYAWMAGAGYSSDAYHPTAPSEDGAGARLAMERALQDAGVQPHEIGYINAHATSTPLGDKAEVAAMRGLLGKAADSVAVSSTKSMTGHLLGAAGSVEAAYTVLALHRGKIPPTINLDNVDPDCEMDHVANTPRSADFDFALSNAFGFGGTNAALLFGKA